MFRCARAAGAPGFVAAAVLLACAAPSSAADSDYMFEKEPKRLALVIGNQSYASLVRLENAVTDATVIKNKLQKLGFTTTLVSDVKNERQFEYEILPSFAKDIEDGDLVAFYFSGHGFSYGSDNFLAPTEMANSLTTKDVSDSAISVDALANYFSRRGAALTIFLLDACRSIPGFKIVDENQRPLPTKSYTSFKKDVTRRVLIGYATQPGEYAIGSANAAEPSKFTVGLIDHLDTADSEFSNVFADVTAEVEIATKDEQSPELLKMTSASLYLKPGQAILDQQREAWVAALALKDPQQVDFFSRRQVLSRHAAAARKWLADNSAVKTAAATTVVPPVAVERAWRAFGDATPRVAILPLNNGFAIDRVTDATASRAINSLWDSELGLVGSGTTDFSSLAAAQADVAGLGVPRERIVPVLHGQVYPTENLLARAEPNGQARVVNIPRGTPLDVLGAVTQGGTTWYNLALPTDQGQTAYVPIERPVAQQPVELGRSLREVVVPPRINGLPELVEQKPIVDALAELKKGGRTVTWVSLATEDTKDETEAALRAIRVSDTIYQLKQNGVDGKRITAAAGLAVSVGEGVRVRIFGY